MWAALKLIVIKSYNSFGLIIYYILFLYRYRLEKEETSDGHEALMQELTSVSVLFDMSVMCAVLILLRALVTVSANTKLGYQDIQTDVLTAKSPETQE